jgi:hypothetical protein
MNINKCIFSEETRDSKPREKLSKKGCGFHRNFYDNSLCRYYLRHEFNTNNRNTITVIMQNPSFADETGLDATLDNVRKFLSTKYSECFSSFEVINLFPIRTSNSDDLEKMLKIHDKQCKHRKKNEEIIQKYIKKSSHILLAWGSRYHEYAKKMMFPMLKGRKLFVYCDLNNDGSPPLFSPRVYIRKKLDEKDRILREVIIDKSVIKLKN